MTSQNPESDKQQEQKPPKPTEDELGVRFIKKNRLDFSFIYGQWHMYETGVWKPNDIEAEKQSWDICKGAKKQGIRPTNGLKDNVLKYAQLYMIPEDEQLDNARYINLQNGLYNLETGELEPHCRELYFTSQLDFDYDENAECPTWQNFLRDVLRKADGTPDWHLMEFLQEAFGYSLTANTDHRTSFWLLGPSGTGKSTFINVLVRLAGDSHTSIDLKYMGKNEYQLADLIGKRLVTFAEPDANTMLSDGDYKRLVSQDIINARNPYGKWIRFVPTGKVWGAMNHLPRVSDRSDGVFNRVKVVPFDYIVPPTERDPRLIDRLYNELPGIFNWAMQGLEALRRRGYFETPNRVNASSNEFRSENDTEAAFVEDWCIRDVMQSTQASHLYKAYKWWCDANGYRPKSSRIVSRDWERLGFTKRKNSVIYYDGVALKPDNERD